MTIRFVQWTSAAVVVGLCLTSPGCSKNGNDSENQTNGARTGLSAETKPNQSAESVRTKPATVATEHQTKLLKVYLEKWLSANEEPAVLHGAPSADAGMPVMLGAEARKDLLALLLRNVDGISYNTIPIGSVSPHEFSMPFAQAVVIGGTQRNSPIVLVIARVKDEAGERTVIQPVGSDQFTGHFTTDAAEVLTWFKKM